jgi:PTH2 family peptidyl-tRNA hydrolase
MAYKQVIVVRDDLDLPRGKLASQVAHASLEAALRAERSVREAWRSAGAKKVAVVCEDEASLERLAERCDSIPSYLVRDAGHTVVPSGTATALGVGPGEESVVDDVTGSLVLL